MINRPRIGRKAVIGSHLKSRAWKDESYRGALRTVKRSPRRTFYNARFEAQEVIRALRADEAARAKPPACVYNGVRALLADPLAPQAVLLS